MFKLHDSTRTVAMWRAAPAGWVGAAIVGMAMLSGCGGGSGQSAQSSNSAEVGGSGAGSAASASGSAASAGTGAWVAVQQWSFDEPLSNASWQLTAEPAAHAAAAIEAGALKLQASMYLQNGQPQCPLARAELALTDPRLVAGSASELGFDIRVSRWDLGLGRFDQDLPRLALVYRGQRMEIGVEGFKAMPATLHIGWSAAAGLSSQYDGVPNGRLAQVSSASDEASTPRLSLSIDGCSQGMKQALQIESVALSLR